MKNINECEICLDENFLKKELLSCHICKKRICFKCFLKITERLRNINENYRCSYCRSEINIYELGRIFHKLNKIKKLDNHLQIHIHWTDTNYDSDSDSTNEDLNNDEEYTNDDITLQRIFNSSIVNGLEPTYSIQNPIINNDNEEIIEVVDLDIKIKCIPKMNIQFRIANINNLIKNYLRSENLLIN